MAKPEASFYLVQIRKKPVKEGCSEG